MNASKGKRVSLALGSGGARGLAHIGIIEWLQQHGYEIASISGASMGALVGGIYAAGELPAYRHWVCALGRRDVMRFLDFAFSGEGLLKGDRIIETLREMVGEWAIEDLPISYTAVATDVDRQREVWITKGPLFDAIRASISVPGVFTPYECRGIKLVDGGLLNPVPVAPTFSDFTDLTIAVNLNADSDEVAGPEPELRLEADDGEDEVLSYQERIRQFLDSVGENLASVGSMRLGVFELTTRSFETMQNAIAAMKFAAYQPDVLINVPRDSCAAHEFHRAKEMIELGYELAEAAMGAKARRASGPNGTML